ncbi:helix-turn-helix domain-containing protein [Conexibacter sp. CPCC 206217]|uniref:helix-turn-helix domain-containing protein n=1 Tax=Conexibacter sp. CPCC 206217 TaxID=3064574 RepID=UPI0027157B3F|nr:helix-turn-helix domain-containing protein [Conexibacter sp. CPCC 206217]MDO8213901.1 helix-turn-helix domain-containing protein [Conexibacter sp. CPCC 206217]
MPIIDDTLTTLKARREEINTDVQDARAEVEAKIADKVADLNELNAVIRAIERQQGATATTGGTHAPRGQNRDKILSMIADGPRTSRAISDATGIGRGSADRTLKQLEAAGEVSKTSDGWVVVPAAK